MTTMALGSVAVIALAGACTKRNPIYCDVPTDCESGFCDVAIHTCSDPLDAPPVADAGIDAAPDADTRVPIVQTYQQADLVLGQADLSSETIRACVPTAIGPISVAAGNGVLYAHDAARYRALAWAPVPLENDATPTRVLGKSSFLDCALTSPVGPGGFSRDGYVAAGGGKLIASNSLHCRILVWNPAPITDGEIPDLALGQPDLMTIFGCGTGANQLNGPAGMWTDGTRIVVADSGNSRVLIWTSFPEASGTPADLVLGQPGFGLGGAPTGPSQSNLQSPSSVWSDGTRLVVSDRGYARVLIWTTFPQVNGQAANLVVGQPDFVTSGSGLSASAMFQPSGVSATGDALFIADSFNDRVLVYSPFPTANGQPASYVLGQPDLDTGANDPAPTARSLDWPRGIVIDGTKLWVADQNHQRVLRFSLYPPP